MRKIQLILSLAVIVAVGFVGCVPQRKFAEVKSAKDAADSENTELQKQLDNVSATTKEQGTTIETLKKSVNKLNEDTTLYGKEYRRLRLMYDKVNDLNQKVDDPKSAIQAQIATLKMSLLELDNQKIRINATILDLSNKLSNL